jgi:hypothetical protein
VGREERWTVGGDECKEERRRTGKGERVKEKRKKGLHSKITNIT